MINLVSRKHISENNGSITTIVWNKVSGVIQVWYKYQRDDIETCIENTIAKSRFDFTKLCDYYSQY